jgi:hypothetical protein
VFLFQQHTRYFSVQANPEHNDSLKVVSRLSISVTGPQLENLMSGSDKAAANHERKQDIRGSVANNGMEA